MIIISKPKCSNNVVSLYLAANLYKSLSADAIASEYV
jgi:hypothetical protein